MQNFKNKDANGKNPRFFDKKCRKALTNHQELYTIAFSDKEIRERVEDSCNDCV